MASTADPARSETAEDFSIVLGGPLYQCWLRTRMVRPPVDLARRRVLAITALAWLPAALLALAEGRFLPGTADVPFVHDIETHVKLLLALPALVIAETVVHFRLTPAVRAFHDRGLVREEDVPRFHALIGRAMKLRNSVLAEVLLLVVAAPVGYVLWRQEIAIGRSSWYLTREGAEGALTAAGAWYAIVSLSISRFLLLRWFFRLFVWGRFLRDVSKLDLRIVATHPDRCGGLGFVGDATYAFGPVLFAQGAVLSGFVASAVFHEGKDPFDYRTDLLCLVGVLTFLVALPCFFFVPAMARAKRRGARVYGILASRYVREFDEKWIPPDGDAPREGGEPLLGSADVQSLADLGNATSVIREMRATPLDLKDLLRLALPVLVPVLPLALTKVPLEEILSRVLKIVL